MSPWSNDSGRQQKFGERRFDRLDAFSSESFNQRKVSFITEQTTGMKCDPRNKLEIRLHQTPGIFFSEQFSGASQSQESKTNTICVCVRVRAYGCPHIWKCECVCESQLSFTCVETFEIQVVVDCPPLHPHFPCC